MAASDEGRAYLIGVVQAGLMGSITVNGTPYMGVMPAQGASYDPAGISEVLNYSVQTLDAEEVAGDWPAFTAGEVSTTLEALGTLNGQRTAALRKSLLENHPELQ